MSTSSILLLVVLLVTRVIYGETSQEDPADLFFLNSSLFDLRSIRGLLKARSSPGLTVLVLHFCRHDSLRR
jgi:hypothetical protein